ncbi:lipocalin family protein [Winogradskyella sp. SM1960]|uniref:lipocalin family protein n=1 Tax=Winogradskyella sp. SM1960 TaxID=2865955 RepID=UPI001CD2C7F3|nr:lipocalin family protein [Winogradskyella sp. SM1960]
MKKVFLLLSVFALVFASCSSNNDDDASIDPIVGTWKYHKYFENGVEQTVTDCEKEETLIFNSNGTFEYIYFDEDMDGNCLLDESISSTWSNDGDGFYTQYIENDVATKEIIFENNTFYFEDFYDNETPDDTSDDMTFKDVFIKQ